MKSILMIGKEKMMIECRDLIVNDSLKKLEEIIPDDKDYCRYLLNDISHRVNFIIERLAHSESERFKTT